VYREFGDGVLRLRRVLGEAVVGFRGARARLTWGNGEDVDAGDEGHGGEAVGVVSPRRGTTAPARVSGAPLFFAGEDEQRVGMGRSEARASPRRLQARR
jgi:hypothetical protein